MNTTDAMHTLEHECRQGRRCKTRTKDSDGNYRGAGTELPNTLCKPCETNAFTTLTHLDEDFAHLQAIYTEPNTGEQGPQVTTSAGHPVPIRLDVDELMIAIEIEVIRWARIVDRDLDLPGDRWYAVRSCVHVLSMRTGTLVDLPTRRVWAMQPLPNGGDHLAQLELDGVDAVLRLAELHNRANQVLGYAETVTWLPEKCHMCGMQALAASKDQQTVKCHSCRNVWAREHFTRLNNPLASNEEVFA